MHLNSVQTVLFVQFILHCLIMRIILKNTTLLNCRH